MAASVVYKGFCDYDKAFCTDESQIKTLRNMNTVLMLLGAWFVDLKLREAVFRDLKFDVLLYKCIFTLKACSFKNLKFPRAPVEHKTRKIFSQPLFS